MASDIFGTFNSSDASTVDPLITTKCYLETIPASIDAFQTSATSSLGSMSTSGRGYIKKRTWLANQFANLGDLGGGLESNRPEVVTDVDGLPVINGEYTTLFVTTINSNETTSNGAFETWEALLFIPSLWNNVKVGTIRLKDSYTATNQSDRDSIWIGRLPASVYPSPDRSQMMELAVDQTGVGYILPSTFINQWTRLYIVHSDLGASSQLNIVVDVLAPNGTVIASAQPITNFVWNPDNPQTAPLFNSTQRTLTRIFDGNTGIEQWKDSNGNPVNITTVNNPLCQVPCDYIPIDYQTIVFGDEVLISNVSGGVPPYTYSFDNGATQQNNIGFDLSSTTITVAEIRPVVFDSVCRSANMGGRMMTQCAAGSWSADFTTPAINDTSYNDVGNRGWSITYSKELGSQLEQTTSPLSWILDTATRDATYLYLGNTFTSPNSSAIANLAPVLPTSISGQQYTIAFNPYNNAHGAVGTTTTFKLQAIDAVTNVVLGEQVYVWAGNTTVNLTDQQFQFIGSGNPVRLNAVTTNIDPTLTGDWWGDLANATITSSSIIKTAATGWNTGIRSTKVGNVSDGVTLAFKPAGTSGNRGMHGLDSDGTSSTYAVMDYGFYLYAGNRFYIYEDGVQKYTQVYTINNATLFEVRISTTGVVTYRVDGVVVYTSTINAGTADYFISSHPYTSAKGINSIVFSGTDPVAIPDVAGHYVRIDNIRLFEGKFSDASHYAKKAGANYLFFRGINGDAVYLSDPHSYSDDAVVIPTFDIRPYGTLETTIGDIDSLKLDYRINNGAWVTMLEHIGVFDAANVINLSPYSYEKGVNLPSGSTIQYRATFKGVGDSTEGYYLYENSDYARC